MALAPDDLADLRHDLGRAIDEIAARTDDYVEAREYYDGTRAEFADSSAARAVIAQSKATPLSFAHIPVDVIVEKVELSSLTARDARGKAALEAWAEKNDLDDEAIDWILKAAYFGDYYVVTDPVGADVDGSITPDGVESVGMSPLSTVVIYDKKTGRTPLFGAHFWDATMDGKKYTRGLVWYDDCTVRVIANGEKVTDATSFDLDYPDDGEPEDAYVEHDADRMLVHHLAIGGKPYGVPLHRKAYGPQDAITKISANNLVNVDALGLPSRWALLDPAAEIDDDIDDDFGTDGPDTAEIDKDGRTNATTGRRSRVVPGAVQFLRGVTETGTYDAAQSDPFLANLDFYLRAMGVACGIPLFELDPSGEVPSGEARRRAEARANRTARRVQRQAGAFFEQIADTVLSLVGISAEVTAAFTPTETASDKDGLELVSLKVKAGVPLRQALAEAGYTEEQIKAWYPPNAPAMSPALMVDVAETLSKLGNAKTLGVVTDDAIALMIPELFRYAKVASVEGEIADMIAADDGPIPGVVTDPATRVKAQADALGALIRSGVDQEEAASRVGLGGLSFPNLPTTIRVPTTDAAGLEQA